MPLPASDPRDQEVALRILEEMTSGAAHIQEQLLEEILAKNKNTEYLKQFLDGQSDKDIFKKRVPVVDYEDIKPFIDRIAAGEPSADLISAEPITALLRSSGTSGGEHKLIPTTCEKPILSAFFYMLALALLNKYFSGLTGGRQMMFIFSRPSTTTSGGLALTAASSNTFENIKSRIILTSPHEVILCQDHKQSMYAQLLCGMVLREEVLRVSAAFAPSLVRAIDFFENHWQELCSNIRTGQVSDWITDPGCRKGVSLILDKPMPELADSIEAECKKESWEGIIKRIWRRTKFIQVIITGSMVQYIPKIEFYGGGLNIVSMFYFCSEGQFGLNLKPVCNPYDVSYTLLPYMAYYEFLPVDDHQSLDSMLTEVDMRSRIVDLANVKMGQKYELIVTTVTGLYRYRVGDILMVTGFEHSLPQFKFIQRKNVVLSIDMDKTSEEDLSKAINQAMQMILEPLGFHLTEYTSYANMSSIPGHYVLFWELQMKENSGVTELDRGMMQRCCLAVEQSLDVIYRKLRNGNGLSPLEIRVVKQGTFNQLMDFCVSQGTSFGQYKTPKCVKSEKAIQILNSGVMGCFYTKELPTIHV